MNDKDWERITNLALFRMYMTNDERNKLLSSPAFWIFMLAILGLLSVALWFLK